MFPETLFIFMFTEILFESMFAELFSILCLLVLCHLGIHRGQIVSLSITCKINRAASKNMQNFIYFSTAKF